MKLFPCSKAYKYSTATALIRGFGTKWVNISGILLVKSFVPNPNMTKISISNFFPYYFVTKILLRKSQKLLFPLKSPKNLQFSGNFKRNRSFEVLHQLCLKHCEMVYKKTRPSFLLVKIFCRSLESKSKEKSVESFLQSITFTKIERITLISSLII